MPRPRPWPTTRADVQRVAGRTRTLGGDRAGEPHPLRHRRPGHPRPLPRGRTLRGRTAGPTPCPRGARGGVQLRTVMTFHQKVGQAIPMPPPSRSSCRRRPRSCTSPTRPTTAWPSRTGCRGPRPARGSTTWRPAATYPGPGVVGMAVLRPPSGRTARSAPTVPTASTPGPGRTQGLPHLRAGSRGRRRRRR